MEMKLTKWQATGLLLGLVFFCLALTFTTISENRKYLFPATIAVFSLACSIILPKIQKHVSIYAVIALTFGLFSLAGSVIAFAYSPFEQSMSISEKVKFYTILHPPQISLGLLWIGMGFLLVLFGFMQISSKSLPTKNNQVYRVIYIFQISSGIYSFFTGIYLTITGLYRTLDPTSWYSQVSQWLAIMSFGLLIVWYMIVQPLIEKKRGMESFNSKSA